jgi:type II secretory pathway pseudopilin PulG
MRFASNTAKTQSCAGFTFAEVLAAMLFLAILVPVVVEGLILSNRAAVVSERTTTALRLAHRQMNELQLNDQWILTEQRGDFGEEWPAYRWELSKINWEYDDMIALTVEVIFNVQGCERRVALTTFVDDSE